MNDKIQEYHIDNYSNQKIESTELTVNESSQSMLQAVMKAAMNPAMDVEKIERLLGVAERILETQRKQAFAAAMARLQPKIMPIQKDGSIMTKGKDGVDKLRSKYAKLETVDAIIRPLLADEGFSFSFNEEAAEGTNRRYSAKLSHKDGHSETKMITLPLDSSDFRTAVQSAGSTNAYARRYLIKMHLNIVEIDEDKDGSQSQGFITEEQIKDLETMMQDAGASKARFLNWFGIEKVSDLPAKRYKDAVSGLEERKRLNEEAKRQK